MAIAPQAPETSRHGSSPADDPQPVETGLPSGWEVRHSNSKNLPYYFNAEQTISRWEPPEGTDTEKLKVYMANHHQPAGGAQRGDKQGAGAVPEGSIWAAHLLVKHNESRNPSSWKEVGGPYLCPWLGTVVPWFERQVLDVEWS